METDLYKLLKTQHLSNEHVCYFLYQVSGRRRILTVGISLVMAHDGIDNNNNNDDDTM